MGEGRGQGVRRGTARGREEDVRHPTWQDHSRHVEANEASVTFCSRPRICACQACRSFHFANCSQQDYVGEFETRELLLSEEAVDKQVAAAKAEKAAARAADAAQRAALAAEIEAEAERAAERADRLWGSLAVGTVVAVSARDASDSSPGDMAVVLIRLTSGPLVVEHRTPFGSSGSLMTPDSDEMIELSESVEDLSEFARGELMRAAMPNPADPTASRRFELSIGQRSVSIPRCLFLRVIPAGAFEAARTPAKTVYTLSSVEFNALF